MNETFIIAVDPNDTEVGKIEKMEAHREGILHRAFSVFVFNNNGELLMQKRAEGKYHSGGLWTNTCCSHPNYGEHLDQAVKRRLMEEMGLNCNTKKIFHFIYRAELDKDLVEHELDHVYFGISDEKPQVNADEVSEWKYMNLDDLKTDIHEFPEKYTVWMQICFDKVYTEFKSMNA